MASGEGLGNNDIPVLRECMCEGYHIGRQETRGQEVRRQLAGVDSLLLSQVVRLGR